jgi:hypothetical protein
MEKKSSKYMVQMTDTHDPLVKMLGVHGFHVHLWSHKLGTGSLRYFRECTETELLQAIMLDTL